MRIFRWFAVLVIASLLFVLPAPAQAATRTLMFSNSGGCVYIHDNNANYGAVTATITASQNGSSPVVVSNQAEFWQNGDGATYYAFWCGSAAYTQVVASYTNGDTPSAAGSALGWTVFNSSTWEWARCGGNVTHTTSQSDTWYELTGSVDSAEWSGFIKYNPPAGGCDIKIDYTLNTGPVTFRQSAADPSKAQWKPENCSFPNYGSGNLLYVQCVYNGATSQVSNKVKIVAPDSAGGPATNVFATVTEKDSQGYYRPLANPGGVTYWTYSATGP